MFSCLTVLFRGSEYATLKYFSLVTHRKALFPSLSHQRGLWTLIGPDESTRETLRKQSFFSHQFPQRFTFPNFADPKSLNSFHQCLFVLRSSPLDGKSRPWLTAKFGGGVQGRKMKNKQDVFFSPELFRRF